VGPVSVFFLGFGPNLGFKAGAEGTVVSIEGEEALS